MSSPSPRKPVLIVVRDGWGVREAEDGNAVALAKTPRLDELLGRFPAALLNASAHAVGLPAGQMGNSEVGHLNIGGGRVVRQDFARIEADLAEGSFDRNPALLEALGRAEERDRSLHLIGLCSDGGVHSHLRHLRRLLEMARGAGVERVFVHAITDGRDTDPNSGLGFLEQLQAWTAELGAEIATVSGRYYAMDRDNRWERVERAYRAIVAGEGPRAESALEAVRASYEAGVSDEFIVPTVVAPDGRPRGAFRRGDQVIAFNFRADRMRELCGALCDPSFGGFQRPGEKQVYEVAAMTLYDERLPFRDVAYPPLKVPHHLSALVGEWGKTQFKCAETEKYAHVTFFWNGGEESPCPGEERVLIPSPRVATYDLQPEMSASQVADATCARIREHDDALVVVNFANPDMVGHTGVLEAAIEAVQVVDDCVGRITDAILAKGGAAIITADHGNCEMMIDPETGRPHTAHTTCPVHAIICDEQRGKPAVREGCSLADIAPTALALMGVEPPVEMTGRSILVDA